MINEDKLLEKTNNEISKYKVLCKAFTNIYDADNALSEKRKKALMNIEKIEEHDNDILKSIYSDFTKQMKSLEDYRTTQLSVIENTIVPACKSYPSKAGLYKKNIGHYQDNKKKIEKQQNEAIKAKSNSETDKEKNLSREIAANKDLLSQTGENIEKDILIYEADRIMDNKYLFLHFIHSELAYHAKALEKLSELYSQINASEPIEKLGEFAKNYNLNVDLADFVDQKKLRKKNRLKDQKKQEEGYQQENNLNNIKKQSAFEQDEVI